LKVTDIITISELARLMNISRPTLYKYLYDYENDNSNNIPSDYKLLFDHIVNNAKDKKDIYNYCMNQFESDDEKAILDKIKMLIQDKIYKDIFNKLTKDINIDKLNKINQILMED